MKIYFIFIIFLYLRFILIIEILSKHIYKTRHFCPSYIKDGEKRKSHKIKRKRIKDDAYINVYRKNILDSINIKGDKNKIGKRWLQNLKKKKPFDKISVCVSNYNDDRKEIYDEKFINNKEDNSYNNNNNNNNNGGIIKTCSDEECLLISTPVYYSNDRPHIGHAYCNILCDVIYKYEKLKGLEKNKKDIIFFSGMDEHGLKIEKKCNENKIRTNEYIDDMCKYYKDMNKKLSVDINLFYRTSYSFHKTFVQNVWKYLVHNNYIYKDTYKGYYNINEERYINEQELREGKYKIDNENIIYVEEENSYFFNILKFKDYLIDFYEKNENFIYPQYLRKQIIYTLKNELRNICISRYNTKWAIQIPDEQKGTIYVWFDALLSYISSILYLNKIKQNNNNVTTDKNHVSISSSCDTDSVICSYDDILNMVNSNVNSDNIQSNIFPHIASNINDEKKEKKKKREKNVPNNELICKKIWNPFIQVIGKDILNFHAIFYICLLKSLNLEFPQKILCHGLIKNENIKMSKSLHNVVNPFDLLKKYNPDVLRLYFIGCGSIYEDKNYKEQNIESFELFLRNNVGNLLYRVVSLCIENNYNIVPDINTNDYNSNIILNEWKYNIKNKLIPYLNNMEYIQFLELIMTLIKNVNKFFVHNTPWNYKKDTQHFHTTIYVTLECMKYFSILMFPFIPNISLTILRNIGFDTIDEHNISLDMLEKKTDKFILNRLIKIV
ncbi:putative methionine--tRNA ligase [Plasmodium gaboni]|uniref:methionine--tRNA ligase n=1 Tax=Plasmodium gaboni TaxID=647221 RepID=A0A151LKL7_9APIC|nr:putative methionine--tRNA ligase [Plasmodium gaboni]KYN99427.1 putative methionine--tRNA ligase [Plasmodium gaboni]